MMYAPSREVPASCDPGLEPVRNKFRAGFEDQILVFEALKTEINGQQSKRALAHISARVHNIAGVAETLGFGEIGSIAISLERAITIETKAALAPKQVFMRIAPQLEELLDGLEAELD